MLYLLRIVETLLMCSNVGIVAYCLIEAYYGGEE